MDANVDTGSHNTRRRTPRAFVNAARHSPDLYPPVEEDLALLRSQAMRAVNEYLYNKITASLDREELADALEQLLDDEEHARLRARWESLVGVGAVERAIESPELPYPKFLLSLVGESAEMRALIDRGHRLMNAYMVASLQRAAHSAKKRADQTRKGTPATKSQFLADSRIPVAWRRAYIAVDKGDIALDSLMALLGKPSEPWLVEELLRIWVAGAHAFLVHLAGFEGVDPPDPSLVRADEIRSAASTLLLAYSAEAGYQERLKAARAAGGWYPTPEPDDD